jgi:hypothetical protein
MKKILLLAIGFCMIAGTKVTYATSISKPVDPIFSEALMQMRAADFVKLSIKELANLSQKKLSLKEKMAFTVLKKKLRHDIKKNPELTVGSYLAANRTISTLSWIGIIASVLLLILVIFRSSV